MNKEIKYIKKIAKQNGYHENFINNLYKKYYNKKNNMAYTATTLTREKESKNNNKFLKYTYNNKSI